MIQEQFEFFRPSPVLRELQMLLEIERNEGISQTELGRSAGVAASMANAYLKRFEKQNFVMRIGKNRRTMRYRLTDEGRRMQDHLRRSYLNETIHLFKGVKEEFRRKLSSILEEGHKRVVLFGARETCEVVLLVAVELGCEVAGVVDSDPSCQGRYVGGFRVESPSEIAGLEPDAILITSLGFGEEIMKSLSHVKKSIAVHRL